MGKVDLDFKPSVPVFDACITVGRRYDRYIRVDNVADTLATMDRAGVQRALAYTPHALDFDSVEGNSYLMEMIKGQPRLVPQFAVNPSFDDLPLMAKSMKQHGVRSLRIAPKFQRYPFREWVLGPFFDWLEANRTPVWVAAEEIDPSEFHATVSGRPGLRFVMSQVHFMHETWAVPLLMSLPNVSIEVSRMLQPNSFNKLIDAIGAERVMFGSRFPDSAMAPQLYYLHRSGLSQSQLQAVCAGNLGRLLGKG
ncbi:MAG: hypothetical protein FJ319_05980 [SAR202 cluster bacterium]|nr:hypothetical protein [SAR202 cluster bacterium]